MTALAELHRTRSIEDIPSDVIPPLFRVQHLNRDVVIGLLGDRGGGKSLGGGMICLLDYMLQGEPCFANMQVKATIGVDDEIAGKYGQTCGGSVTYEAKPLDKYKFLRFDPEYRGGVFFTHEFNIWLADARRSNSTLNLQTNDVGQELRKLQSAWVYDCIHEMFVDIRIRDATDIFIKTSDTALTTLGMSRKQKQGLEFEWWLYPMTKKGAAILRTEQFKENNRPLGPIYIRGRQLWGLIDTNKREKREKYKPNHCGKEFDMDFIETPEMTAAVSKWGWLSSAIKELHDQGYDEVHNEELMGYLNVDERGLSRKEVGKQLASMNVRYKRAAPRSQGGYFYAIDNFDLTKLNKGKKEAVLALHR